MHILLTNDDGLDAYGLSVLQKIVRPLATKLTIVAPASNQSGTGRSISLHRDLRLQKHEERVYSLDGTPTDCVMLGLNIVCKDGVPDLVVSGVNHGMNIGDDVGYSGTVGAAFEAAINGIPAIALSQRRVTSDEDFAPALEYGPKALSHALSLGIARRTITNINFPARSDAPVGGIRKAWLDEHKFSDEILAGESEGSYRIGPLVTTETVKPLSDRYWLDRNFISMTSLHMNMAETTLTDAITDMDF